MKSQCLVKTCAYDYLTENHLELRRDEYVAEKPWVDQRYDFVRKTV